MFSYKRPLEQFQVQDLQAFLGKFQKEMPWLLGGAIADACDRTGAGKGTTVHCTDPLGAISMRIATAKGLFNWLRLF